jgi:hypothetical protein
MTVSKILPIRVLATWLILSGVLPLLHISFPFERTALDLLAIAAGVLLVLAK